MPNNNALKIVPPTPHQQRATAAGNAGPRNGPPAPTHGQTVAALRHFDAILGKLQTALKDPDAGKADMKSKVIDSMTDLVASRMMAPAEAVSVLSTFPERPFEQRQWLIGHAQQTMQARDLVLSHHGAAFAGQGPQSDGNADDHLNDINAMMGQHYS